VGLGYGLDDGSAIPGRSNDGIQTGSGAHTASYPMGTGSSFLGVKAAGA